MENNIQTCVGRIVFVKRKRITDETGIHYPIKEISMLCHARFGSAHIFIEVDEALATSLKGTGIKKGMYASARGCLKTMFTKNVAFIPNLLEMTNARIEIIKTKK